MLFSGTGSPSVLDKGLLKGLLLPSVLQILHITASTLLDVKNCHHYFYDYSGKQHQSNFNNAADGQQHW